MFSRISLLFLIVSIFTSVSAQSQAISPNIQQRSYAYHWVSPEDFDALGGWVVDTQFVDRLGSSYLLAAGVLEPVADARATVTIETAARYQVWARVRDWLPEYHPGTFQVVVNDAALPKVLGFSR